MHWLTATALFGLLGLGFLMTHAELEAGRKFDLYQLHKTYGWLTLWLVGLRIVVRVFSSSPPPIGGRLERVIARGVRMALYFLMVALPLVGWLRVSSSPIPIPVDLFGFGAAPSIAAMNPEFSEAAAQAHAALAFILALAVALHVAAALKHRFIDRDEVLDRMSPWTS